MRKLLVIFLLLVCTCSAKTHRSRAVTRDFQRSHPCPSTGRRSGRCPGYTKDHVVALCAGGADSTSNIQWQSTAEAKRKDRTECRGRKK